MQMQVGRGLSMVARKGFEQKVKRLANMFTMNAKTLIVVNGKIDGVSVDKVIAALGADIQHRLTDTRLYLVRS